jgi:hypothetical protein
MQALRVQTGEYEIIDAGVFHVIEDEETTISLGETKIRLIFDKKEGESDSVEFKALDDKNAELRFINAHGSLGFGTTRPFQIGGKDGKRLFLTFVTRSLSDPHLRTFEFTLYLK